MPNEVQERDRSTIDSIKQALTAVEAAQKSMPNHVESVFGGSDAVRLSEIQRQLSILCLAESEIPS